MVSNVQPAHPYTWAWDILTQLNEVSAMAAIEEVHGAMRGDKPVRNPSAYFTGIARKHLAAMQSGQMPPTVGHGGAKLFVFFNLGLKAPTR